MRSLCFSLLTIILIGSAAASASAAPLNVVTSLPDLASLTRSVGGDDVHVTALVQGSEDPHFVEARPSFLKQLNQADLFIQIGLDLEKGWVPPLLRNAKNAGIMPGGNGYVNASSAIAPLEVPKNAVTRAMGDVHALGSPHYLLDPLNGLRVAALLRDRLSELRPERSKTFAANYEAFRKQMGERMVGAKLAAKYPFEKLAVLYEHKKLKAFLSQQHETALLGGWLGKMQAYNGVKAVDEHNLWPYFVRRFGIEIIGHMEPKPGISPTTHHLTEIVSLIKKENARLIISVPYFNEKYAKLVAGATDAEIAALAHQVGARAGADDYLKLFDTNIAAIENALKGKP